MRRRPSPTRSFTWTASSRVLDPVAQLLHAAVCTPANQKLRLRAMGQLTRELALPVELAVVAHSEREGACKLEVLTELQGSLDVGERIRGNTLAGRTACYNY